MKARDYCIIALALVIVCITPMAVQVYRLFAYAHDQRAARTAINELCDRRPLNVNAETWGMACEWANTAYGNVCFSPDHVSHDELRRFRTDLGEQLRKPVNLATIDWVWDRLGQTGPHGRSYQQRFEPKYRDELEAMNALR